MVREIQKFDDVLIFVYSECQNKWIKMHSPDVFHPIFQRLVMGRMLNDFKNLLLDSNK